MSTGQQHHNEKPDLSFESINAHIASFDLSELTAPTAVQATAGDRVQKLITSYAAVRPILAAVAAIPFIPANWRAVLTAFVITLDQVTASFKAGKDLASSDGGPSVEMEPKLPVG
jgi:hypothetical protein